VIALSLRKLQKSRVILLPEYADDLPPATGDRVPLQPLILNLLPNASDAMPWLTLRASRFSGSTAICGNRPGMAWRIYTIEFLRVVL
jgi:nitrogen-specific signal transduction histidine kinase